MNVESAFYDSCVAPARLTKPIGLLIRTASDLCVIRSTMTGPTKTASSPPVCLLDSGICQRENVSKDTLQDMQRSRPISTLWGVLGVPHGATIRTMAAKMYSTKSLSHGRNGCQFEAKMEQHPD